MGKFKIFFKNIIIYIFHFLNIPKNRLKKNEISFTSRYFSSTFILNCKIGKFNYLGMYSFFKNVKMGNYCSIAAGVQVGGMEHPYHFGSTSVKLFPKIMLEEKMTIIEDDVWIGANAIIRQGITLGRGSIVGAGAVVTHDIEPYAIYVGSPAKRLKFRFQADKQVALFESKYWLMNPKQAQKKLKQIEIEFNKP
jgi:acetyltransferase-like isoleucine patch superfamily enzyme